MKISITFFTNGYDLCHIWNIAQIYLNIHHYPLLEILSFIPSPGTDKYFETNILRVNQPIKRITFHRTDIHQAAG